MNFQQCNYLLAIRQYHSISQAAQALFVTQPSISKAVRELEAELNIQILKRSNKGVQFTKEGQDLLQYAAILVQEEDNLRQHFQQPKDQVHLDIAAQHFSFVTKAFAETIQSLANQQYQLTLHEGHANDVIQAVANGEASIGVLAMASQNRTILVRQLTSQHLTFHSLITSAVHVFLRQNHPLATQDAIRPTDLVKYPDISYRRNDPALSMIEGAAVTNQADGQTIFVDDRATLDHLLLHTDGYNIGTGVTSAGYITPGIAAVPLAKPWQMSIGYLDHGQQGAMAGNAFLNHLKAALK